MLKVRLLLLFMLSGYILPAVAVDELPVLLMLRKSEQTDSTGCNFVEQLTGLVYKEITENRVKLWDSPQKEIQITGSTLKEIEKNSNVLFSGLETVFIYETWENARKEITTKTLGFSFVHRSSTEEEVAFGYVDYNDMKEIFLKSRINTNASGTYSSTYTTYLLSKNYIYNIVQFAGKSVKTTGESEDIKKSFIKNLPFNQSLIGYYPPDKYVTYIVDIFSEGTDAKTKNSKALIKAIEDFFANNQEIFFNMGGDMIASHLQKNKLKVTRVEVNEIWHKIDGVVSSEPKSMTIFVNDSALNEWSTRAMADLEITVNEKSIPEFLKSKDFSFIVTKVNSQVIKRKDSYLYYKALVSADWNRVIEYVVNY